MTRLSRTRALFRLVRNTAGLVLFAAVGAAHAAAQAPTPGQNVNMVSGTQWPGGDPFLQRQNEPSLAVSTRNPLHLLAGANDYRTVDLPLQDAVPGEGLAGDAWLGVFKSFDGGQSWQSTLFPGYPQDLTPEGLASPMKGFTTAADPVVRAGTNGLFYYSGIAFNRGTNLGKVFASLWIDLANKENGNATSTPLSMNTDPIRYVRTVAIASGNAGQFLDKPWLAVDIPRAGAGVCTIPVPQPGGGTVLQTVPAGNVYMSYSVFLGNGNNIHTKLYFTRSTDCGATWENPTKLSEGVPVSQGSIIAVDPATGYVYVAWRGFSAANTPNTINIVKSTDGGSKFSKALTVVSLPDFDPSHPTAASFFDQGTSATTFRTNAFPGLAVDGSGRVYLAWSQRDPSTNGDARIWMRTSSDGTTWSSPFLVDGSPVQDDLTGMFTRGHQFMPAMTFTGGKLAVLYYDQRLDHTVGQFFPNEPFSAAHGHFYNEQRIVAGELLNPGGPAGVGLVFNPVLSDAGLPLRRHTLDLRVAEADPSSAPFFSSSRVSQYKFGTRGNQQDLALLQLQVNPPNLPMFQLGQVPFFGDYIDIAGLPFSKDPSGNWTYTTAPSAGAFHYAAWTTNQDVVPPVDPVTHVVDWTKYTPPISAFNAGGGTNSSIFDPTQKVPSCATPFTGSRNQNIYSSRITQGLLVSSPQNSKPLSAILQRAFVVNVRNETATDRAFRLTIPASSQPAGGYASFTPGANHPGPPVAAPTPPVPLVTSLDVVVGAKAGISRSLYAVSSSPAASMTINVSEIDHPNPGGTIVLGGLSSFLVLNADGTVPPLADPDGAPSGSSIQAVEIYNPNVTNPNVTNPNVTNPNVTNVNTQNPNVTNPNVTNPNVTNPNVTNPNVTNPNVTNADIATPNVTNPNVTNPNVTNPNVTNPNVTNPNVTNPNVTNYPMADSTYAVSNGGNTTATYQVKLAKLGTQPISTPLQLLVNKSFSTPAADNCYLFPQFQNTLQVNVNNPVFTDVADLGNVTVNDPSVSNTTFSLAPGETALVTLRGSFPAGTTDLQAQQTLQQITQTAVVPVAVPAAPNTNDPTNTPKPSVPGGIFITTSALPAAPFGLAYSQSLQQIGGVPPVTWSVVAGALPPGFALSSAGVLTNASPGANVAGTFNFTVQASDSAAHIATRALTLTVNSLNLIILSQPTDTIGGQTISPVQVRVQDATAAPIPGASVTIGIGTSACSGATLSGTTTITTNVAGLGQFSTLSINRGGSGYTLQASLTAFPTIASSTNPFRVEGFCGTTPMTVARKWHTATRLANGKVLIAGGSNGTVALATAELFDPATGDFTPTGGMSVPRAFHSATLLANGTVLVVGGGSGFETGTLASGERYDPNTGLFTPTGGLIDHTRQMHGAVRLNDGRVLVAGGFTNDSSIGGLATAELYDPGTGTFAATAGNMTHDRIGDFTTTLLGNGRVLLAGGFRNLVGGPSADGELFDPASATFSAAPIPMNSRRGKHTAVLQANGQVFLAGGENDLTILSSTEYFDPTTASFVVSLSSQPVLLTARESHTGTRLSDERFLEAGGQTLVGGVPTPIGSAEIYDPYSTTSISATGPLVGPRQLHTATPLTDGTVLLAGGSGSSGTVLNTAEIFRPNVFVGLNPAFAGVVISNVQLNLGSNVLLKPGGGSVTLDHDYFIFNDVSCPSCIDQIEVGLANGLYQACTYDGIPGVAGVSGHGTTTLTVPAAPGRYYVGFDDALTFFCHQFPAWWNGPPGPNRYMGLVIVP